MKKRLVVLCDGTWNRADQPALTNVRKLCMAVDETESAAVPQRVHYEPGVGTRRLERVLGGAFGVGLSRNVQDCYRFLVDNYEPGDELFFIGFSRGAYTARSLGGLVRNSGILRPENRDMVEPAYKLYRSRKPDDKPSAARAQQFRGRYSHPDATITFIGVWDTVGALGIPIGAFRPPLLSRLWTFHDTTLSRYVDNAYHAISIDERRRPFSPTLWVRKVAQDGTVEQPPEHQTIQQVWFAGVHADVGGGYEDPSLAEIPLRWMAAKASACGLALKPDRLVVTNGTVDARRRNDGIELAPNPTGRQHDSMNFFYRALRPYDRRLTTRDGEPIGCWVASTARVRYDTDASYRPLGLDAWLTRGSDISEV